MKVTASFVYRGVERDWLGWGEVKVARAVETVWMQLDAFQTSEREETRDIWRVFSFSFFSGRESVRCAWWLSWVCELLCLRKVSNPACVSKSSIAFFCRACGCERPPHTAVTSSPWTTETTSSPCKLTHPRWCFARSAPKSWHPPLTTAAWCTFVTRSSTKVIPKSSNLPPTTYAFTRCVLISHPFRQLFLPPTVFCIFFLFSLFPFHPAIGAATIWVQ